MKNTSNKIRLREHMTYEEMKLAIESSLLLGFNTVHAEFPIVSFSQGREVPSQLKDLRKLVDFKDQDLPESYISASKSARDLEDFDQRQVKGIEKIFSRGDLLEDRNNDGLVDYFNFKIGLDPSISLELLGAACNFAFRLGMETTEYIGPIVADSNYQGNLILFEDDPATGMEILGDSNQIIYRIYGRGQEVLDFSAKICNDFPNQAAGYDFSRLINEIRQGLGMGNLDGQLAYLRACEKMFNKPMKAYFDPELASRREELKAVFKTSDFYSYKDQHKLLEGEFELDWEVDSLKNILEEKLYPSLEPGSRLKIFAGLSEDRASRQKLAKEVKTRLDQLGVASEINIISAYKQGLSWIEEVVLPDLKGQELDRIEIYFKAFMEDPSQEWTQEDGAVPSYSNIGGQDPEKWLDLPIRYLQELYPIDDIISRELGIDRDQVDFKLYQGQEDLSYEFKALAGDATVFQASYKASYSKRPYLDAYVEMGQVHPSTGFIQAYVDGSLVLDEKIKTDMEQVWDLYQDQVLPAVRGVIDRKIGQDKDLDQPYFSELRLRVEASEPNYRLGIREDLISSLDSLHEDMYFVGLDYFKKYGVEKLGQAIDAPGLIHPIIKYGEGRPSFSFQLYDQLSKYPSIVVDGKLIQNKEGLDEIDLYMKRISYQDKDLVVDLRTNTNPSFVEAYMELLASGLLEIESKFKDVDILRIQAGDSFYSARLRPAKPAEKNMKIEDIDLMDQELIAYEDYLRIVKELDQVEGLSVYEIARSYMGRKIFALELKPTRPGYTSLTKRLTRLPSLYINARHHANEVSSTNGALILIRKILSEEKYKDLYDRLNLVVVPLENVDGSQIHYELQKDNPNWKLHVARFNAVGKEFYHEHFKLDTIHKEALGLTRLWEKSLPDVMVDNHGVPSHEWAQQFSGYSSPAYKGFWLPRSLLYGYFWTIDGEEYRDNIILNQEIEKRVAQEISKHDFIVDWNKEWISRFEKYAHAWMPSLFPADYYQDMINYWIPFEYNKDHRYPSIKYPWITGVAYTSEVADETAQGAYLYSCALAHVAHDQAIIDLLVQARLVREKSFSIEDNQIKIKDFRHRPIIM